MWQSQQISVVRGKRETREEIPQSCQTPLWENSLVGEGVDLQIPTIAKHSKKHVQRQEPTFCIHEQVERGKLVKIDYCPEIVDDATMSLLDGVLIASYRPILGRDQKEETMEDMHTFKKLSAVSTQTFLLFGHMGR